MEEFGMVLALAMAVACDATAWQGSFARYRTTHPASTVQDFYKLAHQGIMGSEHAVRDTARVRDWMVRELAQVKAGTRRGAGWTAEVEPLPPNGRYARVHLRPYTARGADPERLLRAFVATANSARGDTAQFACAAESLKRMGVGEARGYFADRRREGYPAVHHSTRYEGAYEPAYRVVDLVQWRGGEARGARGIGTSR